MYISDRYKFESETEKISFMKQYSFATIITTKDNMPIATQLPFIIDERDGKLILSSHFAAANEQSNYIEDNISLVLFSEPHAYISPTYYDIKQSVPTWNYISVQAYGIAKILSEENSKIKVLEQMIHFYESNYINQWNALSDKYKKGMMRNITAFELEVTDLQGKKKLSQNRSEAERNRIVKELTKSNDTGKKDLAKYIRDTI